MKKQTLSIILMVVMTTIACKKDETANLDDGIYAQFHTNYGDFIAQLDYKKAPMTVANFVSLAKGTNPLVSEEYKDKKYFDGLIFHRVVKGFVIQGGDPLGNGQGGPGYQFPNEINNDLKHDSKGILSMANAGPDTNGSQFFITLAPTPNLDGGYSVFGHIVEGQNVVDSIGQVEVKKPQNSPLKDVVMNQVKIIKKGADANNFDAAEVFKTKMDSVQNAENATKEKIEKEINSLAEGFKKTDSGLRYKITKKVDNGKKPRAGQSVEVYYKGMLTDGKVFDKKLEEDGNKPLSFNVGVGRVIPGWDEGLQLLKEGEEARFIIPPHLGYGPKGAGPIPPNSILIFDVKLAKVGE